MLSLIAFVCLVTFPQWHFCSKFHPNLYKSSHGNVWGVERSRKDQGTGICCQIALFFSQNRINFEKPSKTILFLWVLVVFERFFRLYSILPEKQRNLTTNSSSLILSASFATQNIPRWGFVKKIWWIFRFFLVFFSCGAP